MRPAPSGWIEVICGPMFSGKTEELIRRLTRAKIARQQLAIFKPAVDKRYSQLQIVSHNLREFPSIPIKKTEVILEKARPAQVVGIDEAQFFDGHLVEVVVTLANRGKRVVLSGLDMDFEGRPFGCMPQLMAVAEYVTKIHAVCVVCGAPATHSFRLNAAQREQVFIGAGSEYEPRCRYHFSQEH